MSLGFGVQIATHKAFGYLGYNFGSKSDGLASSNIKAFRHHFVGKRPNLLRADLVLGAARRNVVF